MSLRTPQWMIALLLLVALVPLGSAPTWAEYVLVTVTCLCFLAVVARGIFKTGIERTAGLMLPGIDGIVLLCLPALVLIQVTAAIATGYTAAALTDMLRAGLILLATVLFYVLVHSAVRDYKTFRAVLMTLALIGAAEATYGVFNLLAGNEYLLLYNRWAYRDSATGTLVGRNHFALLMELCLPLAVIASVTGRPNSRAGLPLSSDDIAQRILLTVLTVMMGLALVFSRSRMGILSFMAACLVVFFVAQRLRPSRSTNPHRRRDQLLIPVISFALVAVYVLAIGITPAFERFANLATDLETGRLPIWKAAITMAMDHPIFGHGWGSFASLVSAYKPVPTGFSTLYAHNDYLQVFVESGIIGLALVGWLLFLFVRRCLASLSQPLAPDARTVIVWLSVAIVAAASHSLADFGLRIPGVGFMFAGVLALFVRASRDPQLTLKPRRRRRSAQHEPVAG